MSELGYIPKTPIRAVADSWRYTTLYDADGTPLGQMDLEDLAEVTKDNQGALENRQSDYAEFIVRAINSYHPMIEALSDCLEQMEMISDYEVTRSDITAMEKARKALTLAEKGSSHV